METLNASDAKREFGELILKAQSGPVGINKNGKPVAVVLSAKNINAFISYIWKRCRLNLKKD
ncbi:type II toxin-antitoxin system prevent-host-death family antitoxin [Aliamphritea spongicola]|nr:type II toxin-antitoxin system prevent-host-death family antitoxin [Aliamphritea spongicola]